MSSSNNDDYYYISDGDTPVVSKNRENDDDARPDELTRDFENRRAAVEAVKFYYLKEHDKQMVQDNSKSSGNSTVLICKEALDENNLCKASIRISKRRTKDAVATWFVSKKGVFDHTNCNGQGKPTVKMLAKLKSMKTAVDSNASISCNELATQLQSHHGIVASKRMLYRVKEELGGKDDREYAKSFYLLEPWVQEFNLLNEGSHAEVVWDEDRRFQGLFIYNQPINKILNHSAQDVFLHDCAFMKHNKYNGRFMCMSAVNGNLNKVPVAVALVPAETKENYLWFFNKIKSMNKHVEAKLNNESAVHFSGRDNGLLSAIAVAFPKSHSMNCFKHIVGNISASKSIRCLGSDVSMLWKLQGAISEKEYDGYLAELQSKHKKAAEYLENISGGRAAWALYPSVVNNLPLFGRRTLNVIESENSRWFDAQSMNPLGFADAAVRKMVEMNNEAKELCAKLQHKSFLLTEAIHNLNIKNEKEAMKYSVLKLNDTMSLVKRINGDGNERKVTFAKDGGICSCTEWQQRLYPCRHAIAANKMLKFKKNVLEWYSYAFSPIYLTSSFKLAYENDGIIPPIIGDLVAEDNSAIQRLPPLWYVTPGRPTEKKRQRKKNENAAGGPVKKYKCGVCGSTDHNRRNCTHSNAILNLPIPQPALHFDNQELEQIIIPDMALPDVN